MEPASIVRRANLLVGLANLKDVPEDAEEFAAAHDVFLLIPDREQRRYAVLGFARTIRVAWREQDASERNWLVFVMRAEFANYVEPERKDWRKKPPVTEFDKFLEWFARNPGLFRYCKNEDCEHPYYIPSNRKPSKYCCIECGIPARRAAHRRSYRKHRKHKRRQ
jgi:hypothetical protein